jgi:hypothetical protein
MMTNIVEQITVLLHSYGGWALSAILLIAIVWVYKSMLQLLEKRTQQLMEVIRECGSALDREAQTNREVECKLRDVDEILERSRRLIVRMENQLDER